MLELCIVEILTSEVLLLHRCWHQELLQEDWLPVTRPIHGEDTKILASIVHLDAMFLAGSGDSRCLEYSKERLSKANGPVPLAEASPSSCSCGDWKLPSGRDRVSGDRAWSLWCLAHLCPNLCVLKKSLQFSRLKVTYPVSEFCMQPESDLD